MTTDPFKAAIDAYRADEEAKRAREDKIRTEQRAAADRRRGELLEQAQRWARPILAKFGTDLEWVFKSDATLTENRVSVKVGNTYTMQVNKDGRCVMDWEREGYGRGSGSSPLLVNTLLDIGRVIEHNRGVFNDRMSRLD